MENKLNNIYDFLKANRRYNHLVQAGFYNSCITPYTRPADKAKSLLFHILNTQSQLKLDKAALFWQGVKKNKKSLSSFAHFFKLIEVEKFKGAGPFELLFKALKDQPGWGAKTAALFVKAIYHLHHGNYKQYSFWKDTPRLGINDKLYLPVDAVITHLFTTISDNKTKTFSSINKVLQTQYTGNKMEIWDDLWFWGFITQQTSNGKRSITAFNEAKYWAMLFSDKKEKAIREIKNEAISFVSLIKQNN